MALFNRNSPPHIVTLVLIASIGAASVNMLLPSIPAISEYFQKDYALVQLLISAYLAGTALVQIIIGPLSDRYGRRPILLGCLIIFILATILCIISTSFELLLFGRMIQTIIVSGLTLSRAIVRDMVPAEEAASMISYVTMGMTLVPMFAPAIGGVLQEFFGWQSTFTILALLAVVVLIFVWFDLGETNTEKSSSFAQQFRAYPALIRSRRFWGYTLTASLASGSFFAFLGGGPYVATEILGMSPASLGLYFAFTALGYMFGNFLSGRYVRRIGLVPIMIYGSLTVIFGAALSITLFAIGLNHPLSFFGPLVFLGLGNGLTLPSANAGIVSVRPQLAGSASGLGGAIMIGGGAAISVLAGFVLGPETGPNPLLIIMLVASIGSLLATLYVRHVDQLLDRETEAAS